MELREALGGLAAEHGLLVALVAGRDGLLIDSQSVGTAFDPEQVAALAASSLREMERIGRALGIAVPTQIRLQFDRLELLIEPLTETDFLVAGSSGADGSEQLSEAVAHHRSDILSALSDF